MIEPSCYHKNESSNQYVMTIHADNLSRIILSNNRLQAKYLKGSAHIVLTRVDKIVIDLTPWTTLFNLKDLLSVEINDRKLHTLLCKL